jgi:hypothetical protein
MEDPYYCYVSSEQQCWPPLDCHLSTPLNPASSFLTLTLSFAKTIRTHQLRSLRDSVYSH